MKRADLMRGLGAKTRMIHAGARCAFPLFFGVWSLSCGLFETREPEQPSQSSCFSQPPTRPLIVIGNLENAIAQKCPDNYTACFSPANGERRFIFVPSPEAREQYAALFSDWTTSDEQAYFRNLVAKGTTNGFSNLFLVKPPRDSVITADSVLYNFDYTLTFEHTEPGFPITARGNLQFTLTPDASNFWAISRWSDFKTTTDISWSLFKGKFGN